MGRIVQMITTIDDEDVTYEVVDGDVSGGDLSDARGVWCESVAFGNTDATRAGGAAFVNVARQQEAIAMKLRTMSDAEVVELIRDRRSR